ncbi:hypothetical protein GGI07_003827 [Coemansia sp. Benny D115]|nr:hypothetical protein GGI07_003827 [Coemansia sp. Benny D115]
MSQPEYSGGPVPTQYCDASLGSDNRSDSVSRMKDMLDGQLDSFPVSQHGAPCISSSTWCLRMSRLFDSVDPPLSDQHMKAIVCAFLNGKPLKAARQTDDDCIHTIMSDLVEKYRPEDFRAKLLDDINSGNAFQTLNRYGFCNAVANYMNELSDNPEASAKIAIKLALIFPGVLEELYITPETASEGDVYDALEYIQELMNLNKELKPRVANVLANVKSKKKSEKPQKGHGRAQKKTNYLPNWLTNDIRAINRLVKEIHHTVVGTQE